MGYRGLLLLVCFFAGSASAAGTTLGSDVTAIQIYPNTQSTVYATSWASASEADFYKSTDWGVTWTFMSSTTPALGDLAFDPLSPSVLYISAGGLPATEVIFKSTDGGVTWNEADDGILPDRVVSTMKSSIGPMAVDPANEGVVYAASYETGLYKSTDGGQSWTSINSGLDDITTDFYSPRQLIVDPSNPSTVYFNVTVTGKFHSSAPPTLPSGLYKSTDGGATWNATSLTGVVGGLALDPENSSHLVACDGDILESSTDGGATWTGGASGCPNSTPTLVISDTNPNQILLTYEGSATLFVSNDGGATLNPLYVFPTELFSLAYRSGNVYVGTYANGMYISRDSGATWSPSSSAAPPQIIDVPAEEPTIQAAIDIAASGDTVLVAPGTYYEKLDFEGKAITVKSSGGATLTILDGNNSGPIVSMENEEVNTSVLQGFTLTHAYTAGPGSAVYLYGAQPMILDNDFTDNTESSGNSGCTIYGDISSPIILRNYFSGNTCGSQNGDGVLGFIGGSSPVVADNVFVNNSANVYYQLLPTESMAPFAAPRIYNNTMVGNGAGLDLEVHGDIQGMFFSNNLIAFNLIGIEMSFFDGATVPAFDNNLVYGNTTADYQGVTDQTGTNGNISSDPELKDWLHGDVHLRYRSPAIDVGDSSVSQVSVTDFYANTRVFAGNPGDQALVDIGAAEYQPPLVTATAGSLAVSIDTTTDGTLGSAGTDPDEPLVFALVTQPAHGTAAIKDAETGAVQYVPADGYIGTDSFTFQVKDIYGNLSNTATETVTIADVAPSADTGSVKTTPDTPVSGILDGVRAYGAQKLNFILVSTPAHGTLSLPAGSNQFKYTPATGFAGSDSFSYKVTDAYGASSAVAIESVTVSDIAPKAFGSSLRSSGGAVSGTLSVTKAYTGQMISYHLLSRPQHGSVSVTGTGAFTYTPSRGFRGSVLFTFQVTDQWGSASNVATISITEF